MANLINDLILHSYLTRVKLGTSHRSQGYWNDPEQRGSRNPLCCYPRAKAKYYKTCLVDSQI